MSGYVGFRKINNLANEWALCTNIVEKKAKQSALIGLLYDAIIPETENEQKNRLSHSKYQSYDWCHFFGVYCPVDLVLEMIVESLGLKKLKNGEISKSRYKLDQGSTYTSYLVGLLKLRVSDVYEEEGKINRILSGGVSDGGSGDDSKKSSKDMIYYPSDFLESPIYSDDTEYGQSEANEVYKNFPNEYKQKEEYYIVILADFISEIIKSGKQGKYAKGIYSYYLINYSRIPQPYFDVLNEISYHLFYPAEYGFIDRMTTFFNKKTRDFINLCDSDFSDYAKENNLIKKAFPYSTRKGEFDPGELTQKSISVYYGISKSTLSPHIKKFIYECKKVISF